MESHFARIGGEHALSAIIDEFVDRCFDDPMIGFLFRRAKKTRVKKFEYQHAAAFLGADVTYQGRPLSEAHGPHQIFGGQFERRAHILRTVLTKHAVPQEIVEAWLQHQESLRDQVTKNPTSHCID